MYTKSDLRELADLVYIQPAAGQLCTLSDRFAHECIISLAGAYQNKPAFLWVTLHVAGRNALTPEIARPWLSKCR
jgi:hypothetical protein